MIDRPIIECINPRAIDLVNKDWNTKEPHNIYLGLRGCKAKPNSNVFLEPNDTLSLHRCEGENPISWEGTLVWDGSKLTPK